MGDTQPWQKRWLRGPHSGQEHPLPVKGTAGGRNSLPILWTNEGLLHPSPAWSVPLSGSAQLGSLFGEFA